MEKFGNYKDVDFANNDQFIDWVIHPDDTKDIYWQKVEKEFPDLTVEIKLARKIVLGLYPHENPIQKETIDKIWYKLAYGRKKKTHYFLYAAAVVFISLLVGGIGMAIGLATVGRKVIKVLATEVVTLSPSSALAASISIAMIMLVGTYFGFAISPAR